MNTHNAALPAEQETLPTQGERLAPTRERPTRGSVLRGASEVVHARAGTGKTGEDRDEGCPRVGGVVWTDHAALAQHGLEHHNLQWVQKNGIRRGRQLHASGWLLDSGGGERAGRRAAEAQECSACRRRLRHWASDAHDKGDDAGTGECETPGA